MSENVAGDTILPLGGRIEADSATGRLLRLDLTIEAEGGLYVANDAPLEFTPCPPPEPEPAPPPALVLYSQADPRWRDYEYAPGSPLWRYGCLITCVAMVASCAGYTDTPPEVAAKLKAAGAMYNSYLSLPGKIPDAYPKLEYAGTLNWRELAADLMRVRRELEYGPVILEVECKPGGPQPPEDQHFVLALGFADDAASDMRIADPIDGVETTLLKRYALGTWDLARAIYGARLLRVKE